MSESALDAHQQQVRYVVREGLRLRNLPDSEFFLEVDRLFGSGEQWTDLIDFDRFVSRETDRRFVLAINRLTSAVTALAGQTKEPT